MWIEEVWAGIKATRSRLKDTDLVVPHQCMVSGNHDTIPVEKERELSGILVRNVSGRNGPLN